MGPKKGTKASLSELLAQHPAPPRNDWNTGPPGAPRIGPDGFPMYNPNDFASDEDDGPGPSGAFAALAGLGGGNDDDDNWEEVVARKPKKALGAQEPGPKQQQQQAQRSKPAAPAAGSRAPSRPAPAGGVQGTRPYGSGPGASGGHGSDGRAGPGPERVAPVAPKHQTHGPDGKPLSDDYYRAFIKVYKNAHGAVCLRFHKTDVVVAQPTGEVVVTSGGYRTRTTYLAVAEGLRPMGLALRSSRGEGYGEWSVELADGSALPWQDEMVVPASRPEDRSRAQLLFATYYPSASSSSAPSSAGPRAGAAGHARAAAPPGARPGATGAAPGAGAAPASWSYRAASSAAAARPPPGFAAAQQAQHGAQYAAQHVAPGRAASGAELAALLEDALALRSAEDGHAEELLDDESACVACMARLRNTILIPCGHLVLCAGCAVDVLGRSRCCPICRADVENTVTIED
ncbi:hypothetical protein HYH03_018035 [Edaphochlamys debaryana]|uniref:RING-type domain-containing protein n=1 Tax=Edaphochlamys debaryana TaxID=47281 RepID=A0A835XHB5_9CHLO|nr:hypothetical protein HYH03_018035 [Edaphochlamys debaryana]|eukprot:KAG2483097.1 hypothetical protein HYH03_018035 [Edaphochlamys debaryana]